MQFLFKLAFKNLFRHKLRTFISIIAIAFSVMIVVFARGFITGMIDSFSADNIQYNTGHIKIVTAEYHEKESMLPLNYPVDGYAGNGLNAMIDDVESLDGVDAAIPRLKFGAMSSTDDDLIQMIGWGVIPQKEEDYTNIENFIAQGGMIENGKLEVVMGTRMLEKLNKGVGDKVTVVFNTSFNSMRGVTFEIVGRFETGLRMLNEFVFYLPLDEAQRLLYMDDQSTEMLIMTENTSKAMQILPGVKQHIEENSPEHYSVLSYKDANEVLPWLEFAKVVYNEIYVFLVLLASIVVINTMIMIVKERTSEIGMMAAMGLESRDILNLFLIEGGIMGALGSFVGAAAGYLIVSFFATTGLDLSNTFTGFDAEVLFNGFIYPGHSIGNALFAFVLGVILVTIACLIPALRAARLQPTDAIRDV